MIRATAAAPTAIPAIAPNERVEDECGEEAEVDPAVEAGIPMFDEADWFVLEEAAKDDLVVLDEAEVLLEVAVVPDGKEIVVNAENAGKVMCGVLPQSQL